MNDPNTNAIIFLLKNISPNRTLSVAGFKTVHAVPDRIPVCILEMTPLIIHIWKKSASFDSLANVMSIHMATHTVPELVSLVANELTIGVISAFVEAIEVRDKVIQNALDISNLVEKSFVNSTDGPEMHPLL